MATKKLATLSYDDDSSVRSKIFRPSVRYIYTYRFNIYYVFVRLLTLQASGEKSSEYKTEFGILNTYVCVVGMIVVIVVDIFIFAPCPVHKPLFARCVAIYQTVSCAVLL